ncbi:hypothetical protein [Nitratireductor sp. ZSWI3]|uniref:hypothetical protein n=1 Tax=Nitratireductor sp. ZSWI3 TaxID=2966359 RepID=UPI00214F781B|nr:hypothetical protein [Nitratireductor sp. ZSWI3]MCR4267788.1 hypothetical protein [Nitratireductor sp. ZSWI3]
MRSKIFAGMACGAFALFVAAPAAAFDLGGVSVGGNDSGGLSASVGGISASVGTNDGVSADVNADFGGANANVGASALSGSSLANVDANASVGGSNGLNASSSTTVGGGGNLIDSDTTASLGGSGGLNASVGATVGSGGVNANVDLGVGGSTTSPGTGNPGTGNGRGIFGGGKNGLRAASSLSNQQIAVFRKRCVSILRDPNAWDYDLVQMCKALRQAAAR